MTQHRAIDCADWMVEPSKFGNPLTAVITGNFKIRRSVKGGTTPKGEQKRAMDFFELQFQQNGGCEGCFNYVGEHKVRVTGSGSFAFTRWLLEHNENGVNDRILADFSQSKAGEQYLERVRAMLAEGVNQLKGKKGGEFTLDGNPPPPKPELSQAQKMAIRHKGHKAGVSRDDLERELKNKSPEARDKIAESFFRRGLSQEDIDSAMKPYLQQPELAPLPETATWVARVTGAEGADMRPPAEPLAQPPHARAEVAEAAAKAIEMPHGTILPPVEELREKMGMPPQDASSGQPPDGDQYKPRLTDLKLMPGRRRRGAVETQALASGEPPKSVGPFTEIKETNKLPDSNQTGFEGPSWAQFIDYDTTPRGKGRGQP